jgi:TRAP-type transport system periplasmic protein
VFTLAARQGRAAKRRKSGGASGEQGGFDMTARTTAILVAAALAVLPAAGQALELKFSSPSPPRSSYSVGVIVPWVAKVNAAAKGVFEINLIEGFAIANQRNIYDRVVTNVVQMGWGIQSFFPGKFRRSEVAELPLIYDAATEGAVSLWRMFASGLIAPEYAPIKVVTIYAYPQNNLHATAPVASLADVQGMKVGAFGALRMKLVTAMGATPISVPPPDLYQSMSRGLITAMVMGYSAFPTFKLQEVTKYHLDVPLGGQPGMVFMNKDAYAKLPDAGKKVIDDNSGESFSRLWGRVAEHQLVVGRQMSEKAGKQVFSKISAADRAAWAKRFEPVYAEWAKNTPDGEKVLATFRSEVAKVAAERN